MKVCAVYFTEQEAGDAAAFFQTAQDRCPALEGIIVGEQLPMGAAAYPVVKAMHLKLPLPSLSPVAAVLPALEQQLFAWNPDVVLFENTPYGKEAAARLAVRRQGCALGDVLDFRIDTAQNEVSVQRRIYAQNLHAEYCINRFPLFLCLQVDQDQEKRMNSSVDWQVVCADPQPQKWYQQKEMIQCDSSGNPLEHAQIILAMGRGMSDPHARELLNELAAGWNASIGATRTAALLGYRSLSDMLGISGIRAKPELCIVFGASGSMPFMAGVEKSTTLVAVNRDPDALILEQCDYAIVDTCENVLQELVRYKQGG